MKIPRDGEIELHHALDVFVQEARGCIGRLKLHLDESAGVIERLSARRVRSGERLGSAAEKAEGSWPVRGIGEERRSPDGRTETHWNECAPPFCVAQEVMNVVLDICYIAESQDVCEGLNRMTWGPSLSETNMIIRLVEGGTSRSLFSGPAATSRPRLRPAA